MRNFVIINGVNSNTINGLGINELPPITKPEMRNIREEIDGRDGDIITELGYSAYDKTITIGLFGTGYDINDIVAFFNGEGTIVFSNEQDKYYNFKILNQIDYESLQKFRTASITFHCQPFKYPLSETPLEIEYDYIEDEGETLTLNNTGNATMKLDLKGNTSQSGTPTPTSPVAVSVVSGDNTIEVVGKNLFDKDSVLRNKTFTSANVVSDSTGLFISDYIKVQPNTAYYTNEYASVVIGLDKDKNALGYIRNTSSAGTFTTQANCEYIRIRSHSTTIPMETAIAGAMVNLGTTEPTSYSPYTSQTYPIDLPVENMAQWETNAYTSSALSDLGAFNITLDNSISINTSDTYYFSADIRLKSGTGTYMNTIRSGNNTGQTAVAVVCPNFTSEFQRYIFRCTYSQTQTLTQVAFQIRNGSSAVLEVKNIMVSTNSSKVYTPYNTTPIELCKIGTYQDYFTKNSDGQWCKYNAIGKVVLDGSENWSYVNFNNKSILYTTISGKSTTKQTALSNYYSYTPLSWQLMDNNCISEENNSVLFVRDDSVSSANDYKTWLGTHNLIVYYVLATPTNELFNDTIQEQLEDIQNAMSYEGTTNIGQVNNDKAFIISAKTLEDGTNEVVVNNIGNVYSKPIIALEGSGNVDIYLDNTQILKANVEDKMNIDIAQLEAYNPDTMTLLNRQVIGNYNSMTLQPGNNTIRIDGSLDKATITNYTRYL